MTGYKETAQEIVLGQNALYMGKDALKNGSNLSQAKRDVATAISSLENCDDPAAQNLIGELRALMRSINAKL